MDVRISVLICYGKFQMEKVDNINFKVCIIKLFFERYYIMFRFGNINVMLFL